MPVHSHTSMLDEIENGLMAVGVALLCALIPVVHRVAGPLGPLIGAFVMTLKYPTTARGVAVVGLTVGTVLSALAALGLGLMVMLSTRGEAFPSWLSTFLAPGTVALTVSGVWAYASALAVTGAAWGARLRPKSAEPTPSV